MLELVAATTIISIALVPALKLMRGNLMNLDNLERNEQLVTLCASVLEKELAITAATWSLDSRSGSIGGATPQIRYAITKSDSVSDGGRPGELAIVDVTVWHDSDGGNDLDSGEPRTRFSTKLAKVISYEYEATIH